MLVPRAVVALVAAAAAWAAVRPASANTLPGKPGMYAVSKADPAATPDARAALPVVSTTIDATARGPLIEVVVRQQFTNPGKHAVEAVYIFPLPDDAVVSAMSITTGKRTITAQIAPRDQARAKHEAAVKAGVVGAMLEQERPDVFTQTVTGIAPGAIVDVELRWDVIASRSDGAWELVVPLVVAPRYVPGLPTGKRVVGSGRAKDTDRAPDASRVTPETRGDRGGVPVVFALAIDDARDVTSPTHEIDVARVAGKGVRVKVDDPIGDRDLIVRWTSAARAKAWLERDTAEGFVALTIAAPVSRAKRKPVRLVLAIDRSPSVSGEARVAGGRAIFELVGALGRGDRYAIDEDGAGYRWRNGGPRAVGDGRGTGTVRPNPDLVALLAGARAAFDGAGGKSVQVVLVGDGLVADDAAVIAAARGLGVPVHVIGVGPAPNRSLLRAIAASTGGTLRFASDDAAVAGAVARAVVVDAGVAGTPPVIDWGGIEVTDVVPATLPRLGTGQAITILGRTAKEKRAGKGRASGDGFAIEVAPRAPAMPGATTPRGLIARLWGRARIGELVAANATAAEVTRVAIGFGLVSPYTAMIAVGSDAVVQGGTTRSIAVPVALPAGMRWQVVFGKDGDLSHDADVQEEARQRAEKLERARRDFELRMRKRGAGGGGGGGGGASPDGQAVEPRPEPPPGRDAGDSADSEHGGEDDEDEPLDAPPAKAPAIDATGSTYASGAENSYNVSDVAIARHGRARGLALALRVGGGVSFGDTSRGFGAVGARLGATLGRLEFGLDGSLWVVGSEADTVARGLLSTSVVGLGGGWIDVIFGAGVHVSTDVGIGYGAGIRVGPGRIGGFLRLDGAIVGAGDERRNDAALNLGVEASF
jgi:Ca-activated chloride channel family protein